MASSFVLSSPEFSMGTQPPHHSAARTDVVLLIRRTVQPRGYASGFDSPRALWMIVLSILACSIDRFPILSFGTRQIFPSCRSELLSVRRPVIARRSHGHPA